MERTIFGYVWRYSRRQQVTLTLMAVASLPFLYLFYEVPKAIINNAIQGDPDSFPIDLSEQARVSVLGIDIQMLGPWPIFVEQTNFLFILCGLFLALVGVNQGFKYVINVYKGLTGERMLRRLRFQLLGRVLRFPLPTFRKVSQGEIIPMITAEVEPLGGFIGDSYSLPVFQGGYLLTILTFLFMQDWRMALAAVMLYPLQIWLIPKLQRRVNMLGKERVRRVRQLSDRIGETVQGVQEVHAHDTSNYVLSGFSDQLYGIYQVREKIYRQKFVIKFLNNSIQQLGPFFFYAIGGYFVIEGQLQIGTLVAAIAAHKDLAAPWKELLAYYQQQADANIKYDLVVTQFEPVGMRPEETLFAEPDEPGPLMGEFAMANLTLRDEQETAIVDGLSGRLPLDKRYALVGGSGSGKEDLTLLLSRLLDPDAGAVSVGGRDLAGLPESVTGRRISYVGPAPHIFSGTLADNLLFGLKHRPAQSEQIDGGAGRQLYVLEAHRSGNVDFDPHADWVDYTAASAENADELQAQAIRALGLVAMDDEVYRFGLRGTIDTHHRPELAQAIMRARSHLRERLAADPELSELVETFDPEKYNRNASVAENLMFGTPVGDEFDLNRLADNPYVLQVLEETNLTDQFLAVGYQVAATMVELFADLPPDHELFQQFSFISSDDLPEFQALLQRADRNNLAALTPGDRSMLLSLPFTLVPARHRLGLVDDELQNKILTARQHFAAELPPELQESVEFFDVENYNAATTIQDNILFGKVAYGQAQAQERVAALIGEVVDELDLREMVVAAGLAFDVGIAGTRLSAAQRQKLGLARAVLKQPDVLIVCEATTALDSATQSRIMRNILTEFADRCVIWAVQRASMSQEFDQILVMRHGKLLERGSFADLQQRNEYVNELLAAE